jgi:MoaA/NifB/PqqE/SkfB family radical SAM enzyme
MSSVEGSFSAWKAAMARRSVPTGAQIELTRACNLRCAFCYKSSRTDTQQLSLDEWRRVLANLRTLGTLSVSFTGGEPLLYPEAIEVMREARRLGFMVSLLTNGTLVGAAEADALAALLPTTVEISIHGAQPTPHDSATGVGGSFDAAMKACHLLRERGVRIALKTPVTRWSAPELGAIRELAESWGVLWRTSWDLTPAEDGSARPLAFAPETVDAGAPGRKAGYEVPARISGQSVCRVGRAGVAIDPEGNVFPCLRWRHVSMGSVRTSSLTEIWRTSATRLDAARAAREANEWLVAQGGVAARTRFCPALAIQHGGGPCSPYPAFIRGQQVLAGLPETE